MCLAIPGKVVKLKGGVATIDYAGQKRTAKAVIPIKVGDYVIVQGKIVVETVPKRAAVKWLETIASVHA